MFAAFVFPPNSEIIQKDNFSVYPAISLSESGYLCYYIVRIPF